MVAQLAALGLFVAVFAIAARRNLHLVITVFPVACATGRWLAGMPLNAVLEGFPVGIVVLLAGVTYFFGIAHVRRVALAAAHLVLIGSAAAPTGIAYAQADGAVHGLYHWVHSTADAERSFAF